MLRAILALSLLVPSGEVLAQPAAVPVGVAKVDITPDYPIRLSGYGFRRAESEGVIQKIWAKALVIGDKEPVMALAVDVCGLPFEFVEKLAGELNKKLGLPRHRLAVTVTHTHTSPMVKGYLDTLFGVAVPPEHQAHIERYTNELMAKLITVAEQAWNNKQPATLSWGMGTVTFAKNRRTSGGPTDHDLPLLAVRDLKGKLLAVWVNYACHCTTLSLNRITGDWAGYAAELMEAENPGATALISIGCGADSNPERADRQDKVEYAEKQGGFVAAEARRLLAGFLAPLDTTITTKYATFNLPLAKPPGKDVLEERTKKNDAVGYHARVSLERLAKGEALPTEIPYSVQTWSFGSQLAMVFLPGEVVVDYSLRLKKELHGQRLWVNGYSNHVPCYIPSERILREGGYEGGSAMTYYNLPAPMATGVEEKIIGVVKQQLQPVFNPPFDPNKLGGSKPLSPQQSAKLMKVDEKYTVELVASEPLVTDPVAIAFGPDGRLWVCEMHDYPAGLPGGKTIDLSQPPNFADLKPGGRIKVLEDTDGDGKYDKVTVFLDNISFPTGITVWRKGVLVCAAPDILYAEDTTGSGKADVVKKLYSGFGTHNFQARVNSLEYGLDGWVYGSCGLFGGMITSFNGKTYNLGNRDFRIKPDTGELEPATGQTQQGRVRDDFDNWFGCDNTVLARHYPLPDHYLRRNAFVKAPASSVFLPTGPNANRLINLRSQVQVFELSGPPGWPTAACGLGVYRDDLLGSQLKGNLFTCEPVNLVVHRLQLKEQGATFQGLRAADEASSEFLASTDNWFRPVQMRTGPDGCIWVVDMHRLVIEHPQWIPPADLAKLDMRAGSTMGRIYRIRPADKAVRTMPRLDQMDQAGLVNAMNSPNGTQRDLAMMQLFWKGGATKTDQFASLLSSQLPEIRVQALATLDQLKHLTDKPLLTGVKDEHPGVRKMAWKLIEKSAGNATRLQAPSFLHAASMKKEPVQVLIQMAWSIGDWPDAKVGNILAEILQLHPEDVHLRAVVLSSLQPVHHAAFLSSIIQAVHAGKFSAEFMQQLIPVIVQGDERRAQGVLPLLAKPSENGYAGWQFQAVASLPLMNQSMIIRDATQKLIGPMYQASRQAVRDGASTEGNRLAAMSMLLGPGQSAKDRCEGIDLLFTILGPAQTPAIQSSALAILSKHLDDAGAARLLKSWMSCSPMLRSRMVELFLSKAAWQKLLLQAVVDKVVPASHLDASSKQRLLMSKDGEIKSLAESTFSGIAADRAGLIKEYTLSIKSKGDIGRGKPIFTKVCAVCHQLGEQGHAVGPDLMALANRSSNFLLQEILDPNKNLDNRYIEYVAVTKTGRTLTGMLSSESGNSVTLKGKEGRVETLLRSEIEDLQATGKSLMPEGLEKEITPEGMNDLLAYLSSLQQNYKALAGNMPGGTIKAVDSVHTLPAAQAEVYGQAITFEQDFQNIGMWHGVNDHVTWTIEVPSKGAYDVYFDWACANDNAGNRYILEIGDTILNGEVAGTGGWSQYLRVRVAAGFTLHAGLQRVKLRPAGPTLRGALMDLRTIYIAPAEFRLKLPDGTLREKPDVAALAKQLLDDKVPAAQRQAIIDNHPGLAAELIAAMTKEMPNDLKEEYRRIPWIWRVAVAAGKRNDAAVLRRVMEVGMPQVGEPMRDWQCVVVGGGVINGIGLIDQWPHEHVKKLVDSPAMQARWQHTLKQAHQMADNEKVNTGTRYDGLRIVGLDQPDAAIERLVKHLPKETNDEMQMGAVSGLVDVPTKKAGELLLEAMSHLKGENRDLAMIGMLRSAERAGALLDQVESGTVAAGTIGEAVRKKLKVLSKTWPAALQERAGRLVP